MLPMIDIYDWICFWNIYTLVIISSTFVLFVWSIFGHYKVKILSSGLRCIVWWDLSLIMASFYKKHCDDLIIYFISCTSTHWSKPVPRKWRGPVIGQLYMCWVDFSYQSHDWLVVCFTLQTRVPSFSHGQPSYRFLTHLLAHGEAWLHRADLDFLRHYCIYFMIPPLEM